MHFPKLSRREKEVLAYLSQGLSTSEISQITISQHQYITDLPEVPNGKTGGQKNVAELVYKGKSLF